MQLYRLLTGADDSAFCARVERMLNRGWRLHGSPSMTFDGTQIKVAQAIVHDAPGDYDGFVSLKEMYPEDQAG